MIRRLSAEKGVRPWGWLLAVCVHGVFVIVLVFGVSWHHRPVAPLEAELWSDIPAVATTPKMVPPQPQPLPPPVPVQPAPPKVADQERVPPAADIDIKKKKEAEALKQSRKRERELAEEIRQQRTEALKEKQLDETRRADEASRRQKAALIAKAAQDARASQIDHYKLAIINRIRANTEVPEGVPSGTTLEVDLTVLPTGEILLPVKVVKPSGNPLYDQAVLRGIMRSQPLPLPGEPELRREFRTTHLQLKHEK